MADAANACCELAEKVDALLATTLPARGLFYKEPFCIGIAGGFSTELARECLSSADLIIAVGCRLAQHTSDSGKLFDAENVLHIDVNPLTISQGRAASKYQMCADAKLGVEGLIDALSHAQYRSRSPRNITGRETTQRHWRTPLLAQNISECVPDSAEFDIEPDLLDPRVVVAQLDQALPVDWTVVNSSGHCSYFFAQMPRRPAESFLTIREFGAIGNGIAFAIGAAVARPDKPVVLFDGDGSLLMHIQELETIVRHRLNIVICVMNDGAYGSEIHKLRAEGLSDTGAVFGRRDFSKIAGGFNVDGVVVQDVKRLKTLLSNLDTQLGAAIWDFHVSDKVVSPVVRRSHGI
jgi:thiamine pyrophosphate-dependent acetolactate synthase large subunit-like protein